MSSNHNSPANELIADVLPGSICVQYVKCGKPACACQNGKPHGPYHYRVWREGSQVHKAYVKPEDVEAVAKACEAYTKFSQSLRALRRERLQITHVLERDLRRAERVLTHYSHRRRRKR
jgi:hypothetical protein